MKTRKGFTLVEILIVVVILGILAAIVIPQFTNASTAAKESNLKSNLQTVRAQIELYKLDNNDVPPASAAALAAALADTGGKTYLKTMPDNPFTGHNIVGADKASGDWVYVPSGFNFTFSAGTDATLQTADHEKW